MEAAKVALEQAEMAAVVAATECMNMQKAGPPCLTPHAGISDSLLMLCNVIYIYICLHLYVCYVRHVV